MAEPTDNGSSSPSQPPAGAAGQPLQVRVVGQYIKDLSFENPNIRKLIDGPGEKPTLRVEVNVNATKMADRIFESAIDFAGLFMQKQQQGAAQGIKPAVN